MHRPGVPGQGDLDRIHCLQNPKPRGPWEMCQVCMHLCPDVTQVKMKT